MSYFQIPGFLVLTDTSTLQQQYQLGYSIEKYEERKKKVMKAVLE